jgi:predicted short-subunit dehydrogenase-like oxidoreductase (DUF2520 family)
MSRRSSKRLRVLVFGAGKLGRSLAGSLRAAGIRTRLRAARAGLPKHPITADIVVLAVRDRDLAPLAKGLVEGGVVQKDSVYVHVAGALDATPLAALRPHCAGVAQMHPMISFASPSFCPTLAGGHVHVQGDPIAVKRASRLVRQLGMIPRTFPGLDTVAYHAAAGLVANSAAALASQGLELLARAGVPRSVAPHLLGPLLRSVADNVEALGFPDALTGPVRRGDAAGLERHFAILKEKLPSAYPLYRECVAAQIPLARALGDAPAAQFDAIEALLAKG